MRLLFVYSLCTLALFVSPVAVTGAQESAGEQPSKAAATQAPPPLGQSSGPHGSHDPHAALEPDGLLKVALQHRAEGRMPEAMLSINEAIARYPEAAELLSVRGSFRLEQREVATALEDFEKSLQLRPDDAPTLVNRSQAYRQFKREGKALADLDRAVELAPELLAARFNRGVLHQERDDYQNALDDFEVCVAIDPHSPAPYFNRGAAYEALGERELAKADLERFLELTDDESWQQAAKDILKAWNDQAAAAKESSPPTNSNQE